MHCIVAGMRDPDLPVRVNSVFALRSFVEACQGKLFYPLCALNLLCSVWGLRQRIA